jgi:hypothetical protein
MTNEEKAQEIARNNELYGNTDNKSKIEECYIAALSMARWKDEQHAKVISTIKANIIEARDNKEYYQTNREITLNWMLRLIDECYENL